MACSPPFLYIIKPCVEMREENTRASKVVSQALFSEQIRTKKEEGGWTSIITPDGYSGWIPSDSFTVRETPYKGSCTVTRPAAHLYHLNDIEYGPVATLPYGSKLEEVNASDPRWMKVALPDAQEYYIQKGDLLEEEPCRAKWDLISLSQKFLGLPYTWGGRSSFGFDCSGFMQMLYGHLGILLPRDARQQILDPRLTTCAIDQTEPGDLLFFGKTEQKILHVGLSLGNGQFIHATSKENQPWIRISKLTDFEWSGNAAAHYPYRTGRRLA